MKVSSPLPWVAGRGCRGIAWFITTKPVLHEMLKDLPEEENEEEEEEEEKQIYEK